MVNRALYQRRAAAMLAAGRQVQEVARELAVNPKTVTRWSQRADFGELARKHRESLLPETPTAEAVLTAALSATRPDGSPDWQNRIAAARAILSTPVTSDGTQEAAQRVERVYVEPDVGAPRPFPLERSATLEGPPRGEEGVADA